GFAAARATAAEYTSRLGTNPRLLRCPLGPRAVARLVPRRRRLRLRRDLPRPPFPFRRRVRLPARSGRAGGRARIFPGGAGPRGPLPRPPPPRDGLAGLRPGRQPVTLPAHAAARRGR